jgi:hypothetical protein
MSENEANTTHSITLPSAVVAFSLVSLAVVQACHPWENFQNLKCPYFYAFLTLNIVALYHLSDTSANAFWLIPKSRILSVATS